MTTLVFAAILLAQASPSTSTSKWKVTILEMPRRVMTFRMTPHTPKPPEPGDANYIPPKYLVTGAFQSQFAGTMTFNEFNRARIWKHVAGKVEDVGFVRGVKCQILGLSNSLQVGKIFQNDRYEAVSRPDNDAEFTNLHPKNASSSLAVAMSDGHPVGTVWINDIKRAALWSGSAASWKDLGPKGSKRSEIKGAYQGAQFGCAEFGGGYESAGLWRGSAKSWVNLNPKGSTSSVAEAGYGNYQVGSAQFGKTLRAGKWLGSAASWVSLCPPGVSYSTATGAWRRFQVGTASDRGGIHPCVWEGTPGSTTYLDKLLPTSGSLNTKVYITGDAKNTYIYGTLQGQSHGYDRIVVFTRSNRE